MSSNEPLVRLKEGREKSLLRRHPWIFSGAIKEVRGEPSDGQTVRVEAAHGTFLARAAYSSHSQIRLRVWSWDEAQAIDEIFFRLSLSRALRARQFFSFGETNALRLVHGESDGLPGLVVDRYADVLVVQFLSAGVEAWRETICDILAGLTGVPNLYERSDAEVRRLEGLPERCGPLRGSPPSRLLIEERGLKFWVDIQSGHKTGFYLDQRLNRLRLGSLAHGLHALDCFCYTGGFTAHLLAGGAASVLGVDSSTEALALARENLALNGLPDRAEWLVGDVFHVLRSFRDQARRFDLIVLDPPKFAPTASLAAKAARGYKDINLLAFKLLRHGGWLATFSCSGGVDSALFQKIVAGAALDAGVQAQIVERLGQAADHPVALNFPEGEYLKGLLLRVM